MKLLVCRECLALVKLRSHPETCPCGRSGGTYLADDVRAAVWGPCEVLAIDNDEFRTAVLARKGSGRWLVLPWNHERVLRYPSRTIAADVHREARH